ncbi:MAG: NUDIX domain-containing protein [Candidatus Marinimicrobia bacterium]|nr:NUDIX domain-containing protein [Candidatus Neomarinimicrobiota bacterium]
MTKSIIRVIDSYVFRQTETGIKFLLLKRNVNKIYEHLWQGVAGKIEAGEKAWETAIRELKEETGLSPKRMFVADHVSRFYEKHGDRINLVPVFGIEVDTDEITLSMEHSDYRWVDLEEALQLLIWRGQRTGIKVVHDMVASGDDRLRWSEVKIDSRF